MALAPIRVVRPVTDPRHCGTPGLLHTVDTIIIIVHKIEAVIARVVSEGYHCYYFTQTKVVL